MSVTIVEPTTALRTWMRTVTALGVAARTYAGGLPDGVTFPAISIVRIAGAAWLTDDGEYQFDCWATTASDAASIASNVATWLASLTPVDIGAVMICGANVTAIFPVDDPDDPGVYRYTVTAQVVTKPAP